MTIAGVRQTQPQNLNFLALMPIQSGKIQKDKKFFIIWKKEIPISFLFAILVYVNLLKML